RRRLDSANARIGREALERLERHPADDRIVGGRRGDDDPAERLDLFLEIRPHLRAYVDERAAMAIHLDARGIPGDRLPALVSAAAVDRRQDPGIDLALGHRTGVARRAIRGWRVPLRAYGRNHDHRGGDDTEERKRGRAHGSQKPSWPGETRIVTRIAGRAYPERCQHFEECTLTR